MPIAPKVCVYHATFPSYVPILKSQFHESGWLLLVGGAGCRYFSWMDNKAQKDKIKSEEISLRLGIMKKMIFFVLLSIFLQVEYYI